MPPPEGPNPVPMPPPNTPVVGVVTYGEPPTVLDGVVGVEVVTGVAL